MAELPPPGLGFDLDPDVKYVVHRHKKEPTFNFAMPQQPAETQSDPESDSFGDCLLVELFRDVSPGNVYTGNYVLDKIWATWIACNHIIGNPKAVEFEKEFEDLYFAKKKE